MSPLVCGAEAPPRLCDPPRSGAQAGIGPISQKPELLTWDKRLVAADEVRKVRPAAVSVDRLTRLTIGRTRPKVCRTSQGSRSGGSHTLCFSRGVGKPCHL